MEADEEHDDADGDERCAEWLAHVSKMSCASIIVTGYACVEAE